MLNAIESVRGHRTHIVGQYDAALVRGPTEHRWIIGAGKAHVLHANDIDLGKQAASATHDVVVEILVGKQSEHDRLPLPPR